MINIHIAPNRSPVDIRFDPSCHALKTPCLSSDSCQTPGVHAHRRFNRHYRYRPSNYSGRYRRRSRLPDHTGRQFSPDLSSAQQRLQRRRNSTRCSRSLRAHRVGRVFLHSSLFGGIQHREKQRLHPPLRTARQTL